MYSERQEYQAYLVRLWRVRSRGQWVWRTALECPHTGERYAFASLAALFTFLEDKTQQQTPRSGVDKQDAIDDFVPDKEEERQNV